MTVLNKYHLKELPNNSVNIMRGSIFGNPFVIGKDGTRDEVIQKYKIYLWNRTKVDYAFKQAVLGLEDKNLVCCCKPLACHGDILEAAISYFIYNEVRLKE